MSDVSGNEASININAVVTDNATSATAIINNQLQILAQNIASLATRAQSASNLTSSLNKALGLTASGSSKASAEVGKYSRNIQILEQSLKNARVEADFLQKNLSAIKAANIANPQFGQYLQQYSSHLNSALINQKAFNRVVRGNDLRNYGQQLRAFGMAAQQSGYYFSRNFSAPIIYGLREVFYNYAKLETQNIRVTKLLADNFVGTATASNIDLAKKAVAELGVELDKITAKWGISRLLVQSLAGDYAELGISSKDMLSTMVLITAEMEKLGNLDITASQEFVSSMYQNILKSRRDLGMSVDLNTKEVSDSIAATLRGQMAMFNLVENKTVMSLRNISEAFPEVSAAANLFGLSMTEAIALVTPMVAAGFQLGASANSVKVSLQRMNAMTKQNQQMVDSLSNSMDGFSYSSGVGISNIQLLVDGFNALKDNKGQQGVLEFYSRLFGVRQGPRMATSISQLAQFQDALSNLGKARAPGIQQTQENIIAKQLEQSINMQLKLKGFNTISVNTIEDLSRINKMATSTIKGTDKQTALAAAVQKGQIDAQNKLKEMALKSTQNADFLGNTQTEVAKIFLAQAFDVNEMAGLMVETELLLAQKSPEVRYRQLKEGLLQIGRAIVPIVDSIVAFLVPVVQKFAAIVQNLPQGVKRVLGSLLVILALTGPFKIFLGTLKTIQGMFASMRGASLLGFGKAKKEILDIKDILSRPDILKFKKVVQIPDSQAFYTEGKIPNRFDRFASRSRMPDLSGLSPETVEFLRQAKAVPGGTGGSRVLESGGKRLVDSFIKKFEKILPGTTAFVRDLQNGINSNSENTNKVADAVKKVDKSIKDSATTAEKTAKNAASKISKTVGHIFKGPNEFIGNTFIGNAEGNQFGPGKGRPGSGPSAPFVNPAGGGGGGSPGGQRFGIRYGNKVATPDTRPFYGPQFPPPFDLYRFKAALDSYNTNFAKTISKAAVISQALGQVGVSTPSRYATDARFSAPTAPEYFTPDTPKFFDTLDARLRTGKVFDELVNASNSQLLKAGLTTITASEIKDAFYILGKGIPDYLKNLTSVLGSEVFEVPFTIKQQIFKAIQKGDKLLRVVKRTLRDGEEYVADIVQIFPKSGAKRIREFGSSAVKTNLTDQTQRLFAKLAGSGIYGSDITQRVLDEIKYGKQSLGERYGRPDLSNISKKDIDRLKRESDRLALQDPSVRSKLPTVRKKRKGYVNIDNLEQLSQEDLANYAEEVEKVRKYKNQRADFEIARAIKREQIFTQKLLEYSANRNRLLLDSLLSSRYGSHLLLDGIKKGNANALFEAADLDRAIKQTADLLVSDLAAVRQNVLGLDVKDSAIERIRRSVQKQILNTKQRIASQIVTSMIPPTKYIFGIKESDMPKITGPYGSIGAMREVAFAKRLLLQRVKSDTEGRGDALKALERYHGLSREQAIKESQALAEDIATRNKAAADRIRLAQQLSNEQFEELKVLREYNQKQHQALIRAENKRRKKAGEPALTTRNEKYKFLTQKNPVTGQYLLTTTNLLGESVPIQPQEISPKLAPTRPRIKVSDYDISEKQLEAKVAELTNVKRRVIDSVERSFDEMTEGINKSLDLAEASSFEGFDPAGRGFEGFNPSESYERQGEIRRAYARAIAAQKKSLVSFNNSVLRHYEQLDDMLMSGMMVEPMYHYFDEVKRIAAQVPAKSIGPAVEKVRVMTQKLYHELARPIDIRNIPGRPVEELMDRNQLLEIKQARDKAIKEITSSEEFLKEYNLRVKQLPFTNRDFELTPQVLPGTAESRMAVFDQLLLEKEAEIQRKARANLSRVSPKVTSLDVYRSIKMSAENAQITYATVMNNIIDGITNDTKMLGKALVISSAAATVAKGTSIPVEIAIIKETMQKMMSLAPGSWSNLLLQSVGDQVADIEKAMIMAAQDAIDKIETGRTGSIMNRMRQLMPRGQALTPDVKAIIDDLRSFDVVGGKSKDNFNKLITEVLSRGPIASASKEVQERFARMLIRQILFQAVAGLRDADVEKVAGLPAIQGDVVAKQVEVRASRLRGQKNLLPGYLAPELMDKSAIDNLVQNLIDIKESAQIPATTGAEVKDAVKNVSNSLDEARPDLQKLANALNNLSNKQLVAPTPAAPANLAPGPVIQAASQAAIQASTQTIKPVVNALDAMTSDLGEITKALKALPVSAIKGPGTKVIKEGIADGSISKIIRKARADIERASGMSAKSAAKFAGELKKSTQLISTVQQALNVSPAKAAKVLSQASVPVSTTPLRYPGFLQGADLRGIDIPNNLSGAASKMQDAAEDIKTNINGATKVFAKNIGDAADALEVQIDTAFANVFTGPNLFKGPNQFIGNSFLDGDKIKNIKFVDNLDRTRNIRATPKVDTSKFQYEDDVQPRFKPFGLLESAEMKQRAVKATRVQNIKPYFSKIPFGKNFFDQFSKAYTAGRAMQFLGKKIASVGSGENLKKVASGLTSIAKASAILPRTAVSTFFSSLHNSRLLAPFLFMFTAGLSTVGLRATRAASKMGLFSKEIYKVAAAQSVLQKVTKAASRAGEQITAQEAANRVSSLSRSKKIAMGTPAVFKTGTAAVVKSVGSAVGQAAAMFVKLLMVLTILSPIVLLIGAVFATFKSMGQGSSVAINYLKEAFNNLRQAIMNLVNPILDVIQGFGGFNNTGAQNQAEKSAGAFATLAYFIKQVSEAFKKFSEGVGKSFMTNTFAPFIARIINKFIMLKRAIGAAFTGETETAIKNFKGFLFSIGHDIVGIIGIALRGIGNLFQSASGIIGKFFGYIVDKFIGFTLYILEGFKSIAIAATAAFGIIGGLVTAFGGPLGAPLLGLAGAAGAASLAIIGVEQTLKKNRASIVGSATKIGTAFSNKVGETFVKVGDKAKIVQNKIATAYQKIMGVSLNTPLVKIFKNPGAIADEIKQAVKKAAPAAIDGGESLASKIGKGIKNGLLDLQVEFTEKLFSNLDDQFDKVTNNIKKQLDKQRENALDAFDDMSAGIDALAEAEEKLTKKMDYEEKRREMIRNRATDVENYIRERKLAIYEGRYEDARRLDAEERKSKESADKELLDLDRGYNRDLQAEQREIAKAVIANQKEQLEKQFDLLEEQFDEQVELLKEKGFASKEEFEKALKNLGGIGVDFSEQMATIFGGSMNELPSAISKSLNSAIKLFDTDFNTLVDIAAQKFGATGNVKDPKSILGAAYYMANGVTDAFKSAFNASVIPQYVTPTMDAIKTLLTTTTTSEAITTMWDQAGIRAVNAMIAGIKRTIAGLKGDIFSEFKTKFETLIKELESLATIKITLETIREEEKGDGSGSESGAKEPGFQFEDPSKPEPINVIKKPAFAFGSADNMERQIIAFNEKLRSKLNGSVDNMERQINTAVDKAFDPDKIVDKVVAVAVPALSKIFKEIMKQIGNSMASFVKDNLLMLLSIAIIGPLNLLAATALGKMMTAAWERVRNYWNEELSPWLASLPERITNNLRGAWNGLHANLITTWNNITNWFTVSMPTAVGGFMADIGKRLSGVWDNLFTGLQDTWRNITNWFARNVTNNPVYSVIKGITGRIGGIFQFSAGGMVPVKGYAEGGYTSGSPNTAIPAILHGGEFVLNAKAVERIGVGALTKMNDNRIPYFKKGGFVGKIPTGSALRGKSADMMERAMLGKTNAPLPKVYPTSAMTFAGESEANKKLSLNYAKAVAQGKPVGRSVMDIFSTDTNKITGGIKELGSVLKWGLNDAGVSAIKLGNEINNIVGSVTDAAMSPFTNKSSNPITNYQARQEAQTGKPLNIGAMFGKNFTLQNREGDAPGSKFGFVDALNVVTSVVPVKIPGLSKIGNFASAAISEKMGIGGVIGLKDAISPVINRGINNFVQHIGLAGLDAVNPTLRERITHALTKNTIFADGFKGIGRNWWRELEKTKPRPMLRISNDAPALSNALPSGKESEFDRGLLYLFDQLDLLGGGGSLLPEGPRVNTLRLMAKAKLQTQGIMPKLLNSEDELIFWNKYIDDMLNLSPGAKSRTAVFNENDPIFGSVLDSAGVFFNLLKESKPGFTRGKAPSLDPRIIPESAEVSNFLASKMKIAGMITSYLEKINKSTGRVKEGAWYHDWVNKAGSALGLRPHKRDIQQIPLLNLSKKEFPLQQLQNYTSAWKFNIKEKMKSFLPGRSSKSIWEEFFGKTNGDASGINRFINKITNTLFRKKPSLTGIDRNGTEASIRVAAANSILRKIDIRNAADAKLIDKAVSEVVEKKAGLGLTAEQIFQRHLATKPDYPLPALSEVETLLFSRPSPSRLKLFEPSSVVPSMAARGSDLAAMLNQGVIDSALATRSGYLGNTQFLKEIGVSAEAAGGSGAYNGIRKYIEEAFLKGNSNYGYLRYIDDFNTAIGYSKFHTNFREGGAIMTSDLGGIAYNYEFELDKLLGRAIIDLVPSSKITYTVGDSYGLYAQNLIQQADAVKSLPKNLSDAILAGVYGLKPEFAKTLPGAYSEIQFPGINFDKDNINMVTLLREHLGPQNIAGAVGDMGWGAEYINMVSPENQLRAQRELAKRLLALGIKVKTGVFNQSYERVKVLKMDPLSFADDTQYLNVPDFDAVSLGEMTEEAFEDLVAKAMKYPEQIVTNIRKVKRPVGIDPSIEWPKFKAGGFVPGSSSTPVPATLHGGEYVLNAEAVRRIGMPVLAQLNKAKFSVPEIPSMRIPSPSLQAMSGASSSTQNVNIYVDTFVGEPEWFKSMMKEYNTKILPRNQKAAGLENRVISTYNGLNRGN